MTKKMKLRTLGVLLIILNLLFCNVYASNDSFKQSDVQNDSIKNLSIESQPILKNLDLKKLRSEIDKSNSDLKSKENNKTKNTQDISCNINSLVSAEVYTPFINFLDQQFTNMPNTPGNASIEETFSRIKQSNPTISYSSNYVIDSVYLLSTTINGVKQDYYAMEIVYPFSVYPGGPVIGDHGLIIYNQNYKSHPLYDNGRYSKGFNGITYGSGNTYNGLSIRAGIISAYVPIQKYSHTEFGEYRTFYLFDFFNPAISKIIDGGYDPTGNKPYFVSWVSCGNRIIYGRASWYSDGSGYNELYRVDRILGNQISNNNILFLSNNEFEIGTALTYDSYQFNSTIGDGKIYLIDLNTLQFS